MILITRCSNTADTKVYGKCQLALINNAFVYNGIGMYVCVCVRLSVRARVCVGRGVECEKNKTI